MHIKPDNVVPRIITKPNLVENETKRFGRNYPLPKVFCVLSLIWRPESGALLPLSLGQHQQQQQQPYNNNEDDRIAQRLRKWGVSTTTTTTTLNGLGTQSNCGDAYICIIDTLTQHTHKRIWNGVKGTSKNQEFVLTGNNITIRTTHNH